MDTGYCLTIAQVLLHIVLATQGGTDGVRLGISPRKLKVVEGSPALFECEANDPTATIQWAATNGYPTTIKVANYSDIERVWSVLRLERTPKSFHKKEFECVLNPFTDGFKRSQSARLGIYRKHKVPKQFPVITRSPKDTALPLFGETELHCQATSNGKAMPGRAYRWLKDGVYDVMTSPPLARFGYRIKENGSLVIPTGVTEMVGSYECVAANMKGMAFSAKAEVVLDILQTGTQQCTDRKGNMIPEGESYKPEQDPCVSCTCVRGGPQHCMSPGCAIPEDLGCDDYVLSADVCCEFVCETPVVGSNGTQQCSDRKGNMIPEGESYKPKQDPCVSCTCVNGGPKHCMSPGCAIPDDLGCDDYVMSADVCCEFVCETPVIVFNGSQDCMDHVALPVREGDVYRPMADPCFTCTCSDGEPSACKLLQCERPNCTHFSQAPGTCCQYSCIDDSLYDPLVTEKQCTDRKGRLVPVGATYLSDPGNPCRECVCGADREPEQCVDSVCDFPPCANLRLIPDTCCGFQCLDTDQVIQCTNRTGGSVPVGHYFLSDPDDACTECLCAENGQPVNCTTAVCTEPLCPDYRLIPDTCCGVECIGDPSTGETCRDRHGNSVSPKAVYVPADPCTECLCGVSGKPVHCKSVACASPPGPNCLPVPGECCQFDCHDNELQAASQGTSRLDVRQVGPVSAIVQWRFSVPVKDIEVAVHSGVGPSPMDAWESQRVAPDAEFAVLNTLDLGKQYQIKVVGYSRGTGDRMETNTTHFRLDGRVKNTLHLHDNLLGRVFEVPSSAGGSGEYMYREVELGGHGFLSFSNFDWIDVSETDRSPCPLHMRCGMMSLFRYNSSGVRTKIVSLVFTEIMDFRWAVSHL